jgi:tripartite-type tricarboxylate transporter receptor subunit TctC
VADAVAGGVWAESAALATIAGLPYDAATAVPFAGSGDAVEAMLGQKVEMMGTNLSDVLPAIRAKKLRALVVGSLERLEVLPGVPTARQAELPTLTRIAGWSGLFAPPRLPEAFVGIWAKALAALRADPAWLRATRAEGNVPMLLAPEATRAFVGDQVLFYRDLGRRLGLA